MSIVVPTYNAEKFLDRGLSSFLICRDNSGQVQDRSYELAKEDRLDEINADMQMLEKLEVIVVNDGTPDDSVAVAQRYVDRYPRTFKILNKENGGHGSAINAGVEQVTGKYFKVIDADDWVDTEELAKLINLLERVDEPAIIQGFRFYDISKQQYMSAIVKPVELNKAYSLKNIMDMWDAVYDGLSFHGVAYNTKFYKSQNYRLAEHVFYEDQEYATVPFSYADAVRFVDGELYIYRIGDVNQSVSAQNQIKRLPDLDKVIFKILESEKNIDKMPEGGREHFIRKTSGIITSYYQIAMIKNKDKKQGRSLAGDFNKRLREKSPLMYEVVLKKYKVFKLFNILHMSDSFYENKFLKILSFSRERQKQIKYIGMSFNK